MIPSCLAALLARLSCRAVDLGEIGAARSRPIMVSPRGALLFVAKVFTLMLNKCAARASDETEDEDSMEHTGNPLAMFAEEDSLEDNAAADNGEFENPVADESRRGSKQLAFKDLVKNPAADESQESHSPSPSFCLCNTMALQIQNKGEGL